MNRLFDAPAILRMIATASSCRVLLCLLAVALGAAGPPLRAQPVTSHRHSLQWLTIQAEVIAQGAVESVTPLDPDDSYRRFQEVSIQANAVIKGQAPAQFCFVTNDGDDYEKLLAEKHQGFFFLTSSRRDFNRKMHDYFCTRCPWMCQQVYDLNAKNVSAVSFDESGIHDRDRKLPIKNEEGRPLLTTDGHSKIVPLRYVGRGPDVTTALPGMTLTLAVEVPDSWFRRSFVSSFERAQFGRTQADPILSTPLGEYHEIPCSFRALTRPRDGDVLQPRQRQR